jgi:hypothetical protein
VTLVPASHRRRIVRRSSSTSPPRTPCAPMPNACRSESSRQSGRTGQRAQTAMASAAWSPGLGHIPGNGNQSSGSRRAARRVHVLPDILHYDRTKPATYPNGRIPTDDVYSLRFAWLTNGKIPPSGIKPHDDLLAHFPYLGPPNPTP